MRLLTHAVVALGLALAGAVLGLVAVLVHETRWGLWLGIAATVATLVAVGPGWWRRLAHGAGFCTAIGYAVARHPGGGYLIAADWRGYTLVGFAYVVLALCLGTLPRRVRRVEAGPGT